MKKTVLLTILDGYGLRDNEYGNAVKVADNKVFNMLWDKYPHTKLQASGTYVGLPDGQMGNSEVGHMNIGAGRLVYQPLELINKSIRDEEFFKNEKKLRDSLKGNIIKLKYNFHLEEKRLLELVTQEIIKDESDNYKYINEVIDKCPSDFLLNDYIRR